MGVFAMGPHHSGHAVSYALWVKTDASGNRILINSGSIWSKELKNFFNLHLNDGVPEVVVSERQKLVAKGVKLNDNRWHHVAVSMPSDACLLSAVELYVDGEPVATRLEGEDKPLHFGQAVRLGFGGWNYSHKAYDAFPAEPFSGAMDEISIWTRPLSPSEVKAEFE
jgi:hypothetical protein